MNLEFKKKLLMIGGDLDDQVSMKLWNLYSSFLPRFQFNEDDTFDFVVLVYKKAPNIEVKAFSEAMYSVYENDHYMRLNIFDVFSLEDRKQQMVQLIDTHYKDQLDSKEYMEVVAYSHLLCEEKYQMYQQSLLSKLSYFERELSIYPFLNKEPFFGQNIFYCVEIDHFLNDYLKSSNIPFGEVELQELIVQTYEDYENPNLYQGRLNYVLGNYFPTFDTVEEVAHFLIRYFDESTIQPTFKDLYFLEGYFNQYDLSSFDLLQKDPMITAGERYFMDDLHENKEKTFVQNVFDYFMDEQQKEKNFLFLSGIMIEGSRCIERSFEKEKVLKNIS